MKTSSLAITITAVLAIQAHATAVTITEFHARSVVRRHATPSGAERHPVASSEIRTNQQLELEAWSVYPAAGIAGRDYYIPFFVDLDATSGIRDYDCGHATFDGHTGHDAYVRSFSEMDVGVPVFAPLDGVVEAVRDGEPDRNVDDNPSLLSNYVLLRHGISHTTAYFHLKRGSILVSPGQQVTAGTQIASIGSSGPSTAPHLHVEARFSSVFYEPMAGPCRPGSSHLRGQESLITEPILLDLSLGDQKFTDYRPMPYDDAPRTGTFLFGTQRRVYLRTLIGDVAPNSTYAITIQKPSGSTMSARSGVLSTSGERLGDFAWTLEMDLDRTGTWTVHLAVNDESIASLPFTVVTNGSQLMQNRAPNPVSATIGPTRLRANGPAACRVSGPLIADPDYDVVRYRYEWRSNGAVVRDVTTAAREDVLARQFVVGGQPLSCSVTVSDGKAAAPVVTAHAEPVHTRRRAARH